MNVRKYKILKKFKRGALAKNGKVVYVNYFDGDGDYVYIDEKKLKKNQKGFYVNKYEWFKHEPPNGIEKNKLKKEDEYIDVEDSSVIRTVVYHADFDLDQCRDYEELLIEEFKKIFPDAEVTIYIDDNVNIEVKEVIPAEEYAEITRYIESLADSPLLDKDKIRRLYVKEYLKGKPFEKIKREIDQEVEEKRNLWNELVELFKKSKSDPIKLITI